MKKWMCAILALVLCAFVALAEGARPARVSGGDVEISAPEPERESLPSAAEAPKESASAASQRSDDLPVAAPQSAGEVRKETGAENPAGATSPISGADAAESKPANSANAVKSEAAAGANAAESKPANGVDAAENKPAGGADEAKSETAIDGAQSDAGAGEISATGAQQDAQGDAGTGDASASGAQPDEQNEPGDAGAGEDSATGAQPGESGDTQPEDEEPSGESGEPGEDPSNTEEGAGDLAADPNASEADPNAPETAAAAPEAYVLVGAEKKTGTLAELLAEPGQKTVYLLVAKTEEIPDFPLVNLKDVTLLPDPEAFPEANPGELYTVKLMNGEEEITPDDINNATADKSVNLVASVVAVEPEEPVDPSKIKLTVTPLNYTPGAWMNWSPEFRLDGIPPQGIKGYTYWVMVYGERFFPMIGDAYLPQDEGVYTLRFAIMDPQGDVVSKSYVYEVKLDFTAPELDLAVSETEDYKMTFSAVDVPGTAGVEASGVAEYSLDGGTTWLPLGEGETIVHTESQRKVFPPKTILVRDLAGNIAGNLEEVVLDRLPSIEDVGWGGGGGSSTPSVPHASGNGDDSPYASYELALPQGEVSELTLGGEAIDLHLDVDGQGPANFAAELTAWTTDSDAGAEGEEASAPAPTQDTLVVRAQSNGTHSYVWRINGSVLRKLYNSDIRYLALCADDAMLSLPTVGFTAGTKYAELKMGGVSTAEFVYEISMRTGSEPPAEDWNRSADCAVEIAVSVSGERYVMLDRGATPEMYSYDVYCGPEDLPDYPYGEYPGT